MIPEELFKLHRSWIENHRTGMRLVQKEADLSGEDLEGAYLYKADFSWSDLICLDGFGGYGYKHWRLFNSVYPTDWRMDCLQRSGFIRLFGEPIFVEGNSSLDVYVDTSRVLSS